ncbi:hypothetical protein H5410_032874 [Solanum commersonii]|uniref:Uncharacterized protein n=1 Tax=Solanum commersonii TaxID=4109 RepID=A0A9J5YP56_SOLCO|nr:hypothetical protein H5410_032874 [Solanum commersonii]
MNSYFAYVRMWVWQRLFLKCIGTHYTSVYPNRVRFHLTPRCMFNEFKRSEIGKMARHSEGGSLHNRVELLAKVTRKEKNVLYLIESQDAPFTQRKRESLETEAGTDRGSLRLSEKAHRKKKSCISGSSSSSLCGIERQYLQWRVR